MGQLLTATQQITKDTICLLTENTHTNNFTGDIPSHVGHMPSGYESNWCHNWYSYLPKWPMFCNLSEYVNKPSERRQKLYMLEFQRFSLSICVMYSQYVCLLKMWWFKKGVKEPSVTKFKVDKPSTRSQVEYNPKNKCKQTFKSHWQIAIAMCICKRCVYLFDTIL